MLNIQHIKARDLGDAWFQTIFRILDEGSVFKIDRGSFAGQSRLEFDWVTIHIEHPNTLPLLPQIEQHFNIPNPVAQEYLDSYLPYLMTGEIAEGESYTYGSRMTKEKLQNQMLPHIYRQDHMKDIYIQDEEVWDKVLIREPVDRKSVV